MLDAAQWLTSGTDVRRAARRASVLVAAAADRGGRRRARRGRAARQPFTPVVDDVLAGRPRDGRQLEPAVGRRLAGERRPVGRRRRRRPRCCASGGATCRRRAPTTRARRRSTSPSGPGSCSARLYVDTTLTVGGQPAPGPARRSGRRVRVHRAVDRDAGHRQGPRERRERGAGRRSDAPGGVGRHRLRADRRAPARTRSPTSSHERAGACLPYASWAIVAAYELDPAADLADAARPSSRQRFAPRAVTWHDGFVVRVRRRRRRRRSTGSGRARRRSRVRQEFHLVAHAQRRGADNLLFAGQPLGNNAHAGRTRRRRPAWSSATDPACNSTTDVLNDSICVLGTPVDDEDAGRRPSTRGVGDGSTPTLGVGRRHRRHPHPRPLLRAPASTSATLRSAVSGDDAPVAAGHAGRLGRPAAGGRPSRSAAVRRAVTSSIAAVGAGAGRGLDVRPSAGPEPPVDCASPDDDGRRRLRRAGAGRSRSSPCRRRRPRRRRRPAPPIDPATDRRRRHRRRRPTTLDPDADDDRPPTDDHDHDDHDRPDAATRRRPRSTRRHDDHRRPRRDHDDDAVDPNTTTTTRRPERHDDRPCRRRRPRTSTPTPSRRRSRRRAVASCCRRARSTAGRPRPITFPVAGPVTYVNDWGACRDGCARAHKGNDLIGDRLQPILAMHDGVIDHLSTTRPRATASSSATTRGGSTTCTTSTTTRPGTDDGGRRRDVAVRCRASSPGAGCTAGQLIGWMGDSGNSEGSVPHAHVEIHRPTAQPSTRTGA